MCIYIYIYIYTCIDSLSKGKMLHTRVANARAKSVPAKIR